MNNEKNESNKNNKREKDVENMKEKILLSIDDSNKNKNFQGSDSGSFDKVLQEKMVGNNNISYSFSREIDG